MIFALVVSAAAQLEVDIVVGGVEPIYIVDEPQSVFPTGLNELMGMVEQMQQSQQQQQQQFSMMQNPCANDQVRLRCGPDAACLKAHLPLLAPSCAMFLIKNTEQARPSPSPAPLASGVYSEAYLDQDGQIHIEETQLSPREGKMIQGEMRGMMDLVMSEFFGQPQPQPRSAPVPRPSTIPHPCEAEVAACKRELNGDTSRTPMQQCLVAHYAQLTSGCKCFLHQVMGEELEQAVGTAKSSAEPRMPAVTIAEGRGTITHAAVFDTEPPPYYRTTPHPPLSIYDDTNDGFYSRPPPGHHRMTCALFMMLFFMSIALALRRLCFCCATPKPRFTAVVPPQQPVQMTIEPLLASIHDGVPCKAISITKM